MKRWYLVEQNDIDGEEEEEDEEKDERKANDEEEDWIAGATQAEYK